MKNRRLFWNIVAKIEELIDSGQYPPGSRLPPERELAENFAVSRPTIREAIIALEVLERVEVKTGSGVYVLEHTKPCSSLSISAFELTQARALVEGEAAALAATTITEEELVRLKQTLVEMGKGINPELADKEFHSIISSATRNNAILMAVNDLWKLRETSPLVKAAYKDVCSQSDEKRLAEHTSIYQALADRDSQAARAAMHHHFNRLINALFEANEKKALEEVRKQTSQTRDLYSLSHLVS
ncbi:FadR/GntR family transcriptional regulator [Paraglaciecola aquimarina]|uniref:FadR/GntR family transcriptional regulator n=1 Tax=Paraglaciecola aquimarina TaxID=1235557 RepID=A0ABU3SV74_9ALTE|nr:FadR/GntR family transcriptional regulator [Paraglaciecola aquimarina]MDU0353898.1 FadR/GntR family transcriptional regulator [Paraglaciecola aquimarina]